MSNRTYSESPSVTNRSDRDVTDFVKYLLDGSGAESNVDYAQLRKDLEGNSINNTNILEGLSSKSLLSDFSPLKSQKQESIFKEKENTPTNFYPNLNLGISSASKINEISDLLINNGYQPLPNSFQTLSNDQTTFLFKIISSLINDISRHMKTCRELNNQVSDSESIINKHLSRIHNLELQDGELLKSLTRKIEVGNGCIDSLTREVESLRIDVERYNKENAFLKKVFMSNVGNYCIATC